MADLSSEQNINSMLPPELLTRIFDLLPVADLGTALLVCRRWRELGEKPILWAKMDLKFNIYKEGRGNEQWEVDGDGRIVGPLVEGARPQYVGMSDSMAGWTEELVKVLTMPRMQALEHLTLSFFYMGEVSLQDCMHFLQLVSDFAPSVRKLSWMNGRVIRVTPNPTPVDELAQQLVAKLVKFEEVDFFLSTFGEDFPHYFRPDERIFGNGINAAILRALAAVSYNGEDSRLKVLTLDRRESSHPAESAALVEARKKLTVNLQSSVVILD